MCMCTHTKYVCVIQQKSKQIKATDNTQNRLVLMAF